MGHRKGRRQKNEGSGFYFLYMYTYVKKNGTLRSHTRTLYREIFGYTYIHVYIHEYTYIHTYIYTRKSRGFFQTYHATQECIRDILWILHSIIISIGYFEKKKLVKNPLNKSLHWARAFQIVRIVGGVTSWESSLAKVKLIKGAIKTRR